MHFEILVEDLSGKKALENLVPKIIGAGPANTFKLISYRGAGRIPKGRGSGKDANKRILLKRLPRILEGYGKSFANDYQLAVIIVCDLDKKNCKEFLQSLLLMLNECDPKPETKFCIAIEEGEAWLLGDTSAIKTAYPDARDAVLRKYTNDSIRGTWELLADAVYAGGSNKLKAKGRQAVGAAKSQWAERISPHMDVENNKSPSFIHFREKLRELADGITD